MKNNLVFGGINSADYDVWISGSDAYDAPERDIELVSVPGRNGDLTIDNGRWKNVRVTYPAFIPKGFNTKADLFRTQLMQKTGYQRLEDSYHPEEYRMGTFVGGFAPENITAFHRSGEFDLTFNCKPQRFLKSGETPIQLMPFAVVGDLMSHMIPIGGDVDIEVHCPSGDLLTLSIIMYDENLDEISTSSITCRNGYTGGFRLTTGRYWRIKIANSSDIDATWMRIQTIVTYGTEMIPVDAIMCRKYELVNPTGYAAKPLIEVYADSLPFTTITNEAEDDYYDFRTWTMPEGVKHFWMDCETQWLYDEDHNNLTDKLYITTAESGYGKALVFPEFGTENIEIEMYYSTSSDVDYGIGLIQIYPRWWKL